MKIITNRNIKGEQTEMKKLFFLFYLLQFPGRVNEP